LKKNLVLTGMMGVGKSTVGKSLSKKLNMFFLDIDTIIEKKTGKTIRKIFEEDGELYFRTLEVKTTLDEIKKTNSVISLGGGAFVDKKIRDMVLSKCVVFWLDLSPELIEKRLKNIKKRPLLSSSNLKATLSKIYLDRKKTYNLANYRIDCNKLNLDEIVKKIIDHYEYK